MSPQASVSLNASADRKQLPRHQIHFWVSPRDYHFLRTWAIEEDDTISSLLRQLVRDTRMKHPSSPRA